MENLKLLRTEKKVTQKEVADYLGVARTTYTQYETGASEPDINTIIKIANYFGVSSDTLLGIENNEIGSAIKEEREKQGLSVKDLAESLGVTLKDVLEYETNGIPDDDRLEEKIAEAFNMDSFVEFLDIYNLYNEVIPSHFDGDIKAYEDFKKALAKDQEDDSNTRHVIDTVAAHLEGKNLTPKKVKLLEQYIDALFDEDDD
ncbi:helix-turn-helix transcriptional regulator [Alkaliphilus sp. MSJ-5]|uniref:Helix-turn-helix transcriptional regulator n=1 Tax=Alkaliphilus flagellatus TaxID=2841507 RepID=A0ABS6G827_9FIRM|nr:helix-turn-helix transcriptional regulator [Alkaliphilus flagellatus]MBU5677882.1 helix-turn-helix transcriptional regulator [Alkaliphilus flagellatus]